MSDLLDNSELQNLLSQCSAWDIEPIIEDSNESFYSGSKGMKITRNFKFNDFKSCFAFMTIIAMISESQDHHPDWMNSYHRLEVSLTSHDCGGLTLRDLTLAKAIDAAYFNYMKKVD